MRAPTLISLANVRHTGASAAASAATALALSTIANAASATSASIAALTLAFLGTACSHQSINDRVSG